MKRLKWETIHLFYNENNERIIARNATIKSKWIILNTTKKTKIYDELNKKTRTVETIGLITLTSICRRKPEQLQLFADY